MNKFKKIYFIITVIIVAILGILISVWNVAGHPEYVAAFNGDKLSKQDYQTLEEYADIYAETLNTDAIDNNNIDITKEFNEESIIITVNETRGGINATYPIERKSLSNGGNFILEIDYKNGKYEEYSNIQNILFYICCVLVSACVFGIIIFLIIYYPVIWIVIFINWIIVKVKKKKIEN